MGTWTEWRDATIPTEASVRMIAAATGVDNKSAGRWLDNPRADWVIKLAKAYGADPIEGLIAAGFLDPDDVRHNAATDTLRAATDLELAEEIYRRALAGEAGTDLTQHDAVAAVIPLEALSQTDPDRPVREVRDELVETILSEPHASVPADAADDAGGVDHADEDEERED